MDVVINEHIYGLMKMLTPLSRSKVFDALMEFGLYRNTEPAKELSPSGKIIFEEFVGNKHTVEALPKQDTKPSADTDSVYPFSAFWNDYGKKVDSAKCAKCYARIGEDDRQKIKDVVLKYVASTPEVKFRKNPLTWLHGKCWLDDIISGSTASGRGLTSKLGGWSNTEKGAGSEDGLF